MVVGLSTYFRNPSLRDINLIVWLFLAEQRLLLRKAVQELQGVAVVFSFSEVGSFHPLDIGHVEFFNIFLCKTIERRVRRPLKDFMCGVFVASDCLRVPDLYTVIQSEWLF